MTIQDSQPVLSLISNGLHCHLPVYEVPCLRWIYERFAWCGPWLLFKTMMMVVVLMSMVVAAATVNLCARRTGDGSVFPSG